MTDQAALFYESFDDALLDDVKAIGGLKAVGKMFKPEKDAVTAGRWLADCLNTGRRERLDDEQERYIMRLAKRERGFSAALCFICDDTEFERPKAKSPDDERAATMRTIAETTVTLKRALDTIDRLTHTPLQSVGGGRG